MSEKALDSNRKSSRHFAAELDDLRNRLSEAVETLEAIRSGAVDAIVGKGEQGEIIFTLQSVDYNYRIMVENMAEGAVILDHEGAIIFSNRAFAAIAAKDMTALLGMHFEELLPQEMLSGFAIFAKECLSKALRQEFAVVAGDADIPVSISGVSFMANGHNNLCLIVIDNRERKAAEEKLLAAYEEVERRVYERTKELESFSYSLSHDLRTPLRAMNGFSQILLDDYMASLDPKGQDYLRRIVKGGVRIGEMIDDMLNLAGISRQEMLRQPIDMSALADTVIEGLRQAYPDRRIEVVIGRQLVAHGDERLLRVALVNLLDNAWKYSSQTPNARVEFGAEEKEGEEVFFVRDNGVGFDMKYYDRLFSVFQRLHVERDFPGTGIGLALVHRVIQRHGGRIWAHSEINNGAIFYFTLPLS